MNKIGVANIVVDSDSISEPNESLSLKLVNGLVKLRIRKIKTFGQ